MSASNEELELLKTVFKGFNILGYEDGSYSISHEERKVMHALSLTLRDKNIKQNNSLQMAMVDFVFEHGGNPCITFEKDELPLLEEYTFDAESFLLQLGMKKKEEMPAGSQNTDSSYVASSGRGSPAMWGNHGELSPPLKGTSERSFQKR
jgi:hypothetical protein